VDDSDTGTTIRDEIRALTGLRLVAAVWVVGYHFWAVTPGQQWLPVTQHIEPLLRFGWLGVDLFFVLSGFVLCHSYVHTMGRRPRLRLTLSFYRNRLSRVWPLWVVVTVGFTAWLVLKHLTVGGSHYHAVHQPHLGPWQLLQDLAMVQLWARPSFSGSSIVAPGWSLSAEWAAYVAFPVLVLVLYRLRRWPAAVLGAAAVLVVAPYAYQAETAGVDFAWAWVYRIGGAFVAGALTSLWVQKLSGRAWARRVAPAVAAGVLVAIVVICWWAAIQQKSAVVAAPLFPVLIGALALSGDGQGPARLLSKPLMVTGGRISFALYLVHLCLFEVFWTAMDVVPRLRYDSAAAALAMPVVLVASFPCAYLLWRYVEEPARRWLRGARTDPVVAPPTGRAGVLAAAVRSRMPVPPRTPVPVDVPAGEESLSVLAGR